MYVLYTRASGKLPPPKKRGKQVESYNFPLLPSSGGKIEVHTIVRLRVCVRAHSVGLDQHSGLQRKFLFLLDVVAHVAQLLLHHPHRLKVSRVVEGVTS